MDVKKNCAAVAGRLIFIGFLVQMILGILWMCNAFAEMKNFGEGIVCVGQILVLGGALWIAMPAGGAGKKLFGVLAAESFPMVLQTLLKPDLRILPAVILLLGAGLCRKRNVLMWAAVLLGIVVGFFTAPEKDLPAVAAGRITWTTLYQDYNALDEDVKGQIEYSVMADSTYEAGGVEHNLVPDLRMRHSQEEVEHVLRTLMRIAWRNHKNRILKEILWDAAAYLIPPVVVPMQLAHRAYDSYTGLNYRQFLQPAPRIGKYAMRYGNAWFLAAIVLRIGLIFLGQGNRTGQNGNPGVTVYIFGTAVVMAGWYTFCTAGRMDYRNVMYILCLWLMWTAEGMAVWQKEAASDVIA